MLCGTVVFERYLTPSATLHPTAWQYPLLCCTTSAGINGEADAKDTGGTTPGQHARSRISPDNSDLQNDMTISKKARRNDCACMVDSKGGIGNRDEKTLGKVGEKVLVKGP